MQKKIPLSLLILTLASGCSAPSLLEIKQTQSAKTTSQTITDEVSKNFYEDIVKNLDYKFFHKAINELKLPESIKSKINSSDKIIICSADKTGSDFDDIQYIIENSLKTQCLSLNYIVLERDYIPLKRIYSEKNRDLSSITPSANLNATFSAFKPMFSMVKPLLDTSMFSKINFKTILSSIDNLNPPSFESKNTSDILFADKLITYRILESGIKKAKIISTDKMIRIAGVIIEINLIETETSRILASQIVEHFNSDEITMTDNASAEKFRLENIKYPFPLILGYTDKGTLQLNPSKSAKESTTIIPKIIFKVALGSYSAWGQIYNENQKVIYNIRIPSGNKYTEEFEWDFKDAHGNIVPKGKYIFALVSEGGGTVYSQKSFIVEY